ncbi:MAG TPA: flagellar biosynthetic protein FliO [Bdellovibrionales bacterium]|nr:flagellar biosynthetic protein FliO [Bdellovibrionales bacterium]
MHILLILLASFSVLAAEATRPVTESAEERILAASDEDAALLLAEEFKNAKAEASPEKAVDVTGEAAEDGQAQVAEAKLNLKESQIPVLADSKKAKEEPAQSPIRKMVISLGIILAAILGVAYAARKWLVQKKTNTPNAQIRIVTQQYLGPRKSLAIVYVAGESLLVGITDNQINLIKQLSLIDDELPGNLPQRFDDTLSYTEATQPEAGESFSMKGLKDIVSNRLRNMREI